MPKPEATVHIDMTQLDEAIEKANRLVALLEEAQRLRCALRERPKINDIKEKPQ